jgi:hypothetical protein
MQTTLNHNAHVRPCKPTHATNDRRTIKSKPAKPRGKAKEYSVVYGSIDDYILTKICRRNYRQLKQ